MVKVSILPRYRLSFVLGSGEYGVNGKTSYPKEREKQSMVLSGLRIPLICHMTKTQRRKIWDDVVSNRLKMFLECWSWLEPGQRKSFQITSQYVFKILSWFVSWLAGNFISLSRKGAASGKVANSWWWRFCPARCYPARDSRTTSDVPICVVAPLPRLVCLSLNREVCRSVENNHDKS